MKTVSQKVAESLSFKTISSYREEEVDRAEFQAFLEFLEETFPRVYRSAEVTVLPNLSLIFKIPAAETSKGILPELYLAHYDVVPAGDPARWTHDPYGAVIENGVIWGRGSIDCKHQLIVLMEAMETLLAEGCRFDRDLYFAFGADEEVGGMNGAKEIARRFEAAGLRFGLILDEGGVIASGMVDGISQPLALIGLAEKGMAAFECEFRGTGGHSSMPPAETALTRAAAAITAIQKKPLPLRLTETAEGLFKGLAPAHKLGFLLKHLRYLLPLIGPILSRSSSLNAMLRTTQVATVLRSGEAHNVLPQTAVLTVNCRILQGDTVDSVLAHLIRVTETKPEQWTVHERSEPSPTSKAAGASYTELTQLLQEHFPDAAVVPYLMLAGSDCRHYSNLSDSCFRFAPLRLTKEEIGLVHAYDERVKVEGIEEMLRFYLAMFRRRAV